MRTARLLTIPPACWPYPSMHCQGCPCWGVYLPSRVYLPGGVPAWVVYLPGGCTCLGGVPAQGVYLPGGVGCTCWGCTCPGVHLPGGCTCPGGVPARGSWCTCWGCTCPGGVPAQGVYLSCPVPGQVPSLWTPTGRTLNFELWFNVGKMCNQEQIQDFS